MRSNLIDFIVLIKEQVILYEKYVLEHELYQHDLEKFIDWSTNLASDLLVNLDSGDSSTTKTCLEKLKSAVKYFIGMPHFCNFFWKS